MAPRPSISFAKLSAPKKGAVVLLTAEGGLLSEVALECDPDGQVARASEETGFKAKACATLEILAPSGSGLSRLAVIGTGKPEDRTPDMWARIGGAAMGACGKSEEIALVADLPEEEMSAQAIADIAMGMILRAYNFDKYKSADSDRKEKSKPAKVSIRCADPAAAKKAWTAAEAVAQGVELARDLVNEPANILGPVEFAAKARELEALGVEVEILTEKEMTKLKMGALLGVAQGSVRPPRLAIMTWKGGKAKDKPVAFIGKGVVFDTGGISIKPAAGMEDMKGDMGGAAAVTGLMHTLAARKARVNAIGLIGLVENMPDGNAQRPGDIVKSMSGKTIEVLNTDAEGRLVLCDVLHYAKEKYDPRFMINLATLTGAIIIALGNSNAGLFSNNDELAGELYAAGQETGETVWRMPLGKEYDKLIDSKNADMKNIGGRWAGAITAAQFLQRFVGETPWAHLDVAGTAMGSPSSEISKGWASGFGVRLLDQLVRDHYEG